MKFTILFLLSCVGICSAQVTTIISAQTNNGGFEQSTTGWNFQSDSGQNKWVLGAVPTAGFSGGSCAFVSNSTSFPLNHQYTPTSSSITKLYRNVIFPINTSNFNLKFKVLVQGNTYDAKLDVYLLPTSTALDVNISNYGTPLATYQMLGTSWQDKSVAISNSILNNSTVAVTKQLVFIWSNYNSSGAQPPAAIDDVTVDNCSAPTNITNVAAPAQLNLNWESLDTAWEIRYKIDTANAWITANAASKPFVINGLPASTVYKVQIRNSNLTCTDWSAEFTTSTIPTNGSCANAIDIQGQDDINTVLPYLMNFTGAVLGAPTPQCGTTFNATAKEVWYKFTATTTRYIIDSSAYIKAEVYEGSCGNLTFLTCKNGVSYIENVVIGNQYYIRFISDSNVGTQINFRFLKSPQPPVNDLCVNAIPLTNATGVSSNLTGSTFDTTPPSGNLYGNVLGDVWFTFIATENFASITAASQTAGAGSPSETLSISLYTGSCNNFVLFQNFSTFDNYSGGSTKNTNQLQIGTTYYVRVSSLSGMAENRIFGITVTAIASPANDLCVNATLVNLSPTGLNSIGGYYPFATPSTGLSASCLSNNTNDIWYKFVATSTKYLTKSNGTFVVYSGDCSNLIQIYCGKNYVLNNLILGDSYYVRADNEIIYISEFEASDECTTSPILIAGINPDYVYSSTINATISNIPSICSSQANDVWYQFVATSSRHRVGIEAYSQASLSIDLYSGNCVTILNQVPCAQVYNGFLAYKNLVVGQTYFVKVSRADNGQFGIKIITIFVEPNDEIQNATQIVPAVSGLPCSGYVGTMSGTQPSININNSCQQLTNNKNDVWYSFIATTDAYKLEFSSGSFFSIAIYKELNTNSIEIFSCGESSFYGFTIGVKYFIRIVEYSIGAAPNFSFCISAISNRPVNDNCTNAINVLTSSSLSCTNTYNADFTKCTYDLVNPINDVCVGGNFEGREDVWFKFTATASKMLINNTVPISLSNGNATLKFTLYNNCNQLNCVNHGDYVERSSTKFLNNLTIGTEYLLRMQKTSNPLNIISFCITSAPTIINDEIVNAKILVPSSDLSCGNLETNVINIATPSLSLNVSGCASNFNTYTSSQYNDRWYKFVATNNEHVLDFEYIPGYLYVQLFSGTSTNLMCQNNTETIFSNSSITGTVFSNLVIGTTYYLRLIEQTSNLTEYKTYNFCLKTPLPIPVNDEYISAINLIPSTNLDICNNTSSYFNRSTQTTNVLLPSCSSSTIVCNEDIWFKFIATAPSHQLHVYNNNVNALNVSYMTSLYDSLNGTITQEVSCYNPFSGSSSLSLPIEGIAYGNIITYQNYTNLIIGNTYYIRMYQYYDQSAYDFKFPVTFDICLKTLPEIPVNNTIATSTNISSNSASTPQYINGYTTRGKYLSNTSASTSGVNCYELNAFVIPGNAASNAWYKFTATQTSYQLNVINDANVLFPLTNVLTYSLYPLIVSLYQYDNTVLKVKDCGLNTTSNLIFSNLLIGKEYYIKLMYPAVTYFTDFEFQIGLANVPLGTSSFEIDALVVVFPNPANDFLNIRIPNNIETKTLEITNVLGQKVLNQQFNSEETKIDVSKFQAGTYLIKVKSESEETTSKFIKL